LLDGCSDLMVHVKKGDAARPLLTSPADTWARIGLATNAPKPA
jgi:hypothetical protein